MITTEALNGNERITVKDNGIGIPGEIRGKVFDPYFTTKFQAQGVGISLYMAKMIVERNFGGLLRLENETEEGTKFIVELH